jgi:hypothetical protein
MKKALVVSFPRSGTHFLINTLSMNFGYAGKGEYISLEPIAYNLYVAGNMLDLLRKFHQKDSRPIFVKSHHDVEFFETKLSEIMEMYTVFYIYRNPEDVMESYRKHINGLPWLEGPKCETAEEFAESMPVGGMLRHQYQQYKTMTDKHWAHVAGWNASLYRERIVYVKYEDLNERFIDTVKEIGKQLGETPSGYARPDKDKDVIKDGRVFLHV